MKAQRTTEREAAYRPYLKAIRKQRNDDPESALDERALVFLARELLRDVNQYGEEDLVGAALILLEKDTRGEDALLRQWEQRDKEIRKRRAAQARKNFGHKRSRSS